MLKVVQWKDFLEYVRDRLVSVEKFGVGIADLKKDLDMPTDFLERLEKRWRADPPKDFSFSYKTGVITFFKRNGAE